MALTGDADGPPLDPGTDAADLADRLLAPFGLDAGVLAERAAHSGLRRQGRVSCGGATRLVRAADGWFALALARTEDLEAIPALLRTEDVGADPWGAVTRHAEHLTVGELVEQGALLGLAISAVGAEPGEIRIEGEPRHDRDPGRRAPVVADLSALWAGPLCGHLLHRRGARVIKIESMERPDGARRGVRSFHDLLNRGKESVALSLRHESGRRRLRDLVESADVVITSSRRRAVEQVGLDPASFLESGTDRVWVAITGHGWHANRIGFGDDAAAAAGLVALAPDGSPRFAGDAIADPLCGVLAAHEALRAWQEGGRRFLDLPLTGAAARVEVPRRPARPAALGPDGWAIDGHAVHEPRARPAGGAAAELGADNDRLLEVDR